LANGWRPRSRKDESRVEPQLRQEHGREEFKFEEFKFKVEEFKVEEFKFKRLAASLELEPGDLDFARTKEGGRSRRRWRRPQSGKA
jgi:hypothetical protein